MCSGNKAEEIKQDTLMLPKMSFFTGVNATEPRTSIIACSDNLSDRNRQVWNPIAYLPNSVVRLSAASRKAAVSMALSLLAFTGTSTKDFLSVSNQVPPKGYVAFAAIIAVAAGFSVSARSTNVIP